jgi:hypothetical protein
VIVLTVLLTVVIAVMLLGFETKAWEVVLIACWGFCVAHTPLAGPLTDLFVGISHWISSWTAHQG